LLGQEKTVALNPEFSRFVTDWLTKADQIQLSSLATYFDKFFTLYVVYNRLYAEATFSLSRNRQINISHSTSFPDKKAATSYVLRLIGSANLVTAMTNNPECTAAIHQIEALIERNQFSIKLHMVTGERQRDKDEDLLRRLRHTAQNTKAEAILELIYSIRCNTFHGHKGFEEVQVQILAPVIVLLRAVIELIREHLANHRIRPTHNPRSLPQV
jgi:hypothetical protein